MQAKATLDIEQIEDKLNRGAKEIEIHTTKESYTLLTDSHLAKVRALLNEHDAKIISIHLPIVDRHATSLLDIINEPEEFIRWAIHVPLLTNGDHPCSILVHQDSTLEEIQNSTNLRRGLRHIQMFLNGNMNIMLEIENALLAYHPHATMQENVKIIEWLRSEVSPNIHAVLDTCHWIADGSQSFAGIIPLTSRVHFSNCIGDGTNMETHGILFNSQDTFNILMNTLEHLKPDLKFCAEVQEKDYTKSENYTLMLYMNEQRKLINEANQLKYA